MADVLSSQWILGDCSLMKHDLLLNKDVLSGLLSRAWGVRAFGVPRLLIGTTAEMRAGFIPTAPPTFLFFGGVTAIGGIVREARK